MYIIAEIGNNHDGDPQKALELVKAACESGVDAVKMQHFKAETLVNRTMPPPDHAGSHRTMYERLKSLELPWLIYESARGICDKYKKEFVITPFDVDSVPQCAELAHQLKVASGDVTYRPLLEAVAKEDRPAILSTGMATDEEIYEAASILDPWAMLHCVSKYPCEPFQANLSRIQALKKSYPGYVIGYSDHCVGGLACEIAASMGAEVIEKHFTLGRWGKLGDHRHSLNPWEMKEFVKAAKRIEEYIGMPDRVNTEMRTQLRRGPDGLRGSYRDYPEAV